MPTGRRRNRFSRQPVRRRRIQQSCDPLRRSARSLQRSDADSDRDPDLDRSSDSKSDCNRDYNVDTYGDLHRNNLVDANREPNGNGNCNRIGDGDINRNADADRNANRISDINCHGDADRIQHSDCDGDRNSDRDRNIVSDGLGNQLADSHRNGDCNIFIDANRDADRYNFSDRNRDGDLDRYIHRDADSNRDSNLDAYCIRDQHCDCNRHGDRNSYCDSDASCRARRVTAEPPARQCSVWRRQDQQTETRRDHKHQQDGARDLREHRRERRLLRRKRMRLDDRAPQKVQRDSKVLADRSWRSRRHAHDHQQRDQFADSGPIVGNRDDKKEKMTSPGTLFRRQRVECRGIEMRPVQIDEAAFVGRALPEPSRDDRHLFQLSALDRL